MQAIIGVAIATVSSIIATIVSHVVSSTMSSLVVSIVTSIVTFIVYSVLVVLTIALVSAILGKPNAILTLGVLKLFNIVMMLAISVLAIISGSWMVAAVGFMLMLIFAVGLQMLGNKNSVQAVKLAVENVSAVLVDIMKGALSGALSATASIWKPLIIGVAVITGLFVIS